MNPLLILSTLLFLLASGIARAQEPHSHGGQPCQGHAHDEDDDDAEEEDAADHDHDDPEAIIPDHALRLLGVTTVEAQAGIIGEEIRISGSFQPSTGGVTVCGVPVTGFITLHVKPGQPVKTGDPLFSVASPELIERRQAIAEARAALAQAETFAHALADRLQALQTAGGRNAELTQQLAERNSERDTARQRLATLERAFADLLSGTHITETGYTVTAPRPGIADCLPLPARTWNETGSAPVRIVDPQALLFQAEAPLAESLRLRAGMTGRVENAQRKPLTEMAEITLAPIGDPQRRTRGIYLQAPVTDDQTFPGMPATLAVNTCRSDHDHRGQVVIPAASVAREGLTARVFLRDSANPNRFTARPVILIEESNGLAVVEGIHPGEAIVVHGAYELKQAFPAAAASEKKVPGHFHADGQFHTGTH